MKPPAWEKVRPRFQTLVFRRGVAPVAREIPTSRASVYNWVKGERVPNRTAQARIREILREKRR